LKKTVGLFARALERKAVHPPRSRNGTPICSPGGYEKFILFIQDFTGPVTFLSTGIDAGTDQLSDRDPTFGQGAAGYAKRLGADLADRATFKFFRDFAFPALFDEDPRYYRLEHGTARQRILHGVGHLFVASGSDGSRMFNYSAWLGTASSVAVSDVYHPGADRGAAAVARQVGSRLAWNVGFDLLREFWPDIAREFRLPFRGAKRAPASDPSTTSH
jgi:hypothetical protein